MKSNDCLFFVFLLLFFFIRNLCEYAGIHMEECQERMEPETAVVSLLFKKAKMASSHQKLKVRHETNAL